MSARRMYLPAPEPYIGEGRCEECRGTGVTGARYVMDTDGDTATVVDEICPACDGCGRAKHVGCMPDQHADWDLDDDERDDDVMDGLAEKCPSCYGRRWWTCQGFGESGPTMSLLRVPCGCAEPLMVELSAVAEVTR